MRFYLYDANLRDIIQNTPPNSQFHRKTYKLIHSYLGLSLSSMKRTCKKNKGRQDTYSTKGRKVAKSGGEAMLF